MLKAAKYGKHVLCKKPLDTSVDEIRVTKSAMEDAGKILFTGFTERFSPSAGEVHRLVREGSIGEG